MNNASPKIVLSLTSYPARIGIVDQTIRSLLAQTVKPWKIVLWLTREEFPDGEKSLPEGLLSLTRGTNFEIDWSDQNYRPYNKLVHSLRKYPDCAIVTVDDDLVYPKEMMARLMDAYRKEPAMIHAMRVRVITVRDGIIQPFWDWLPSWFGRGGAAAPSLDNSILGFGGVLYPPGSLDPRATDMDLAMQVCPNNDDFWFWAMAVMKGTLINGVSNTDCNPVSIAAGNIGGLWEKNREGGNDSQMADLLARFPEIAKRLALRHPRLPQSKVCCRGTLLFAREGGRNFSFRLSIPLFQMKYNEDFTKLTYYILRIPVWRRHFR